MSRLRTSTSSEHSPSWSRAVDARAGRLLVARGLGSCVCQRTGTQLADGDRMRQRWVHQTPSTDYTAEYIFLTQLKLKLRISICSLCWQRGRFLINSVIVGGHPSAPWWEKPKAKAFLATSGPAEVGTGSASGSGSLPGSPRPGGTCAGSGCLGLEPFWGSGCPDVVGPSPERLLLWGTCC